MIRAGAQTQEQPQTMIVNSDILGPLEVEPDAILHFPLGLFGMPECREFAFLPAHREGLYWLQSVEHSELAFVLVDPFLFFPGYAADVTAADLADLETADASDVAILAIVTLPGSPAEQPTANLQGPLALSLNSHRGKQLALSNAEYGVRCPFDLGAAASS